MSTRTIAAAAGAGLAVACAMGGYAYYSSHSSEWAADDAASAAANSFARAWQDRALNRAAYVGTSGSAAAANFTTATAELGKGAILTKVASVKRTGDTATATINVRWVLPDGAAFTWADPISLAKQGSAWGVQVDPNKSLWHLKLQPNDSFVYTANPGTRGDVLGANGASIMTNQSVHDVQLDPTKATSATYSRLEAITGLTGLAQKYKDTKALATVVTYRESDYQSKKNDLSGLAGVTVADRTQPLAPTRAFAQPVLGSVGPVTAEMLKKNPKKYTTGQIVGLSGLQAQYDDRLAAKAGALITSKDSGDVLFRNGGGSGQNLQTTLDPKVQNAADAALATLGSDRAGAIVAIDVKSGNVLAVGNWPTYGMERALAGHYTPGSTLKVVTTYALLTKGLDPNSTVECPQTLTVDGLVIRNFEDESLDKPSFRLDFAKSCNTAFVKASEGFTNTTMHDTASAFGIGGDWASKVGGPAYSGSVPVASSDTERAASVFGQGRTQASPLALAAMAGDVARCSVISPVLVTDPNPGGDRTPKSLDSGACASLRDMMRYTVTDGTATSLKDAPGGDVYGKTGTAEVSDGGTTGANAWFAGWQGDIAFAVLVPDVAAGDSGGTVAVPVARQFLTELSAQN